MRVEEIIIIVENTLAVDLNCTKRDRPLVEARMIVARIAQNFDFTLTTIGDALKKDHSSIIHYRKKFDDFLIDKEFSSKYSKCVKAFDEYIEENPIVLDLNIVEGLKIRRKILLDRVKVINQLLEV